MPPEDFKRAPITRTIQIGVVALILVAVVWIVFVNFSERSFDGSVTTITFSRDGTRALSTVTLNDFSVVPRTDITNLDSLLKSRGTYTLTDGSVITMSDSGLERLSPGPRTPPILLLASPIPPTVPVAFAVWNDGEKIAWINPADNSVQVFERSARGAYLPAYLSQDLDAPNSIGFNDTGSAVVVTTSTVDATDFYAVDIQAQKFIKIGSIPGYVSIIPTP